MGLWALAPVLFISLIGVCASWPMPSLVGDFEESESFEDVGEFPSPTIEDWYDRCLFSEALAFEALLCSESVLNFDN